MTDKIPIKGPFSKEKIKARLGTTHSDVVQPVPKYMITDHPGFELVTAPTEQQEICKLAYGKLYREYLSDLDIELDQIAIHEARLNSPRDDYRKTAKRRLIRHYKKAISLLDKESSAGWNRWSENILELFLSNKLHKIVWGSGNCGKSRIMGLLLYIKWRVKPNERCIVIASKVVADASARVFGYIKNIHENAPVSEEYNLILRDTARNKGIYHQVYDQKTGRYVDNDQACIISLPIKTNAKRGIIGANLQGKHPKDRLVIAFDEAQELPAVMTEMEIYANWLTNERLDIYAWGNPIPVDYYTPTEHDLLFRLGAKGLSLDSLKKKAKEADTTGKWSWHDTEVLHLSMLDSPKDDEDERNYYLTLPNGTKRLRLSFLGGKGTAEAISDSGTILPTHPTWYSQVLGFPYINVNASSKPTVLVSGMIKNVQKYPLKWYTPPDLMQYYMGVDAAISGSNDRAAIAIGRMGAMVDGRTGLDLMNGKACRELKSESHETDEFTDKLVQTMYNLSVEYNIPLQNIGLETHGTNELAGYALRKFIEENTDTTWYKQSMNGESVHYVSPVIAPTERHLFKQPGKMIKAKDMCTNVITEYWVAVRCGVITRQIFNIPQFILNDYYQRYLEMGIKYKIETKKDLRTRGIKSPNNGDAMANLLDVCRVNGNFTFKFYNRYNYVDKNGVAYTKQQLQGFANKRMGLVSQMLSLSKNFDNIQQEHDDEDYPI